MMTTSAATRAAPRTVPIIRQPLATYRASFVRVAVAAIVVLVPLDVTAE